MSDKTKRKVESRTSRRKPGLLMLWGGWLVILTLIIVLPQLINLSNEHQYLYPAINNIRIIPVVIGFYGTPLLAFIVFVICVRRLRQRIEIRLLLILLSIIPVTMLSVFFIFMLFVGVGASGVIMIDYRGVVNERAYYVAKLHNGGLMVGPGWAETPPGERETFPALIYECDCYEIRCTLVEQIDAIPWVEGYYAITSDNEGITIKTKTYDVFEEIVETYIYYPD